MSIRLTPVQQDVLRLIVAKGKPGRHGYERDRAFQAFGRRTIFALHRKGLLMVTRQKFGRGFATIFTATAAGKARVK